MGVETPGCCGAKARIAPPSVPAAGSPSGRAIAVINRAAARSGWTATSAVAGLNAEPRGAMRSRSPPGIAETNATSIAIHSSAARIDRDGSAVRIGRAVTGSK